MDTITAYLNLDIDIILYIQIPTSYKVFSKVDYLQKTIYKLK